MSWYPKGIDPYKGGVYAIKNKINGKLYIGSTSNLRVRLKDHKALLKGKRHHSQHLQNSWNHYGGEIAFTTQIFEFIDDVNKLQEREQYYLDLYPRKQKYNVLQVAVVSNEYLRKRASDKNTNNKPVCQLDRWTGELIQEFNSIIEAARAVGVLETVISSNLSARGRTGSGFLWQLKEDYDNNVPINIPKSITRAVCQLDLEGNLINIFDGLREATRETNIARTGITQVANGITFSVGGYCWVWLDHWYEGLDITKPNSGHKRIYQLDGETIVAKFDNIMQASQYTGVGRNTISKVANKQSTAGGFTWIFADNYENNIPPPKTKNGKPVYKIDPLTNEILARFESVVEAAKHTNVDPDRITFATRIPGYYINGFAWCDVPYDEI